MRQAILLDVGVRRNAASLPKGVTKRYTLDVMLRFANSRLARKGNREFRVKPSATTYAALGFQIPLFGGISNFTECREVFLLIAAIGVFVDVRKTAHIFSERQACDVRLRAERRCGELLRELERATPQTASPNGRAGNRVTAPDTIPEKSPYAQAIEDTGMSRQRANRMEALANVPDAEFEQALSAGQTYTTRFNSSA